ncbi:hypothetical protein J5N97_015594 [Dioscorea zingiberensis]|uniref:Acidic protein n=1 Tax=Dioscorea zingiberensis TaxID=325984 RepID=A0A9D5CIN5_9LILI|nr:hypothetical protein J5N97_015594 [Dioscorea zingiberensis]
MEGKGVRVPLGVMIMVVVILGLNLAPAQTHSKVCCTTFNALHCYDGCYRRTQYAKGCEKECPACTYTTSVERPTNYPNDFCKLGCASSMCSTISTLQNSDDAEQVVAGCNNKCSEICNKGYNEGSNAVFTA